MASKKQKAELIDALKFTPIRARILIQGYGGECYIGTVPRETYEFFKSKRIDLEQYVGDWDGTLFDDVPAKHRFCEPGSPYDCDGRFHCSGATMDDCSRITVMNDDTNEDIWESHLDINHLESQGVDMVLADDFDSGILDDGDVIFWGGQGEKGCFFDGEIELRAPFDPKKLRIYYGNGDDWRLSAGVEYDGEEVDGTSGYSTTGKWGEHKFFIVGGEAVYEGQERSEDCAEEDEGPDHDHPEANFDEDIPVLENEETWASRVIDESMLSPWHPADAKPVHKGVYEVEYTVATWPFPVSAKVEWTGRRWKHDRDSDTEIARWRGLNQPAE